MYHLRVPAKLISVCLLVGLLGSAFGLARTQPLADPSPVTLRFVDVTDAAGIHHRHHPPSLDPRLEHIAEQVSLYGATVSVVDVDRDGWQDLFFGSSAAGSPCRLYRNLGDGRFEDIAASLGLADLSSAGLGSVTTAVWGDANGDGWEDLLVGRLGRVTLHLNREGRRFEPAPPSVALARHLNVATLLWLDYDQDGHLDAFAGGYYGDTTDLRAVSDTKVLTESFEYSNNGGAILLLRGLGDGTFDDVTGRVGLAGTRWTLAAAAADFDRDGDVDLFVANDYAVSEVWLQDEGRFVEVGKATGPGRSPKSGMSATVGDPLNQGRLAVFETNISESGVLLQGNNLWLPREAAPAEFAWDERASEAGVKLTGWAWGARFGDLDNDGNQDLVVVNGHITGPAGGDYWYDLSSVSMGHRDIISDARSWPALRGRSWAGSQRTALFLGDGAGHFAEVDDSSGVTDRLDGRAVVLVDLFNRGVLDMVVANQRGPALVYRNEAAATGGWIGFELEGRASNRSAIGAEVELHWGDRRQLQVVLGGDAFTSQGPRRLHFGLGTARSTRRAIIRWPSGREQVLEAPSAGRLHRVVEPW